MWVGELRDMGSILITGATGFLGFKLLKSLLNHNCSVVALTRTSSNAKEIQRLVDARLNVSICVMEVDDIPAVLKSNGVKTIIHTATAYDRDNADYQGTYRANVTIPLALARFGIAAGVEHFINTDSYYSKTEDFNNGLENYARTKNIFRAELNKHSDQINITHIRIEHMYGPGDSDKKFITRLVSEIAIEKSRSIDLTPGRQKIDLIHVWDVVQSYLAVINKREFQENPWNVFIGTGALMSIVSIAEYIKDRYCSPSVLNFGAVPYSAKQIMESCSIDDDFRSKTGWSPRISFEAGMDSVYEDLNGRRREWTR